MASLSNPFSYNEKVKIVLLGRRKIEKKEKKRGDRYSWAVMGSTPNIQRVSFPWGWVGPAGSIWAPEGGLTVMEDFPAVFPCFNKDLDSFLWETICMKETQGGDTSHIFASMHFSIFLIEFYIYTSPLNYDINVHLFSKVLLQTSAKYRSFSPFLLQPELCEWRITDNLAT